MPIVAGDIKQRFSGGASNSVPASSLGGIKSSVDATAALFDDVLSAESAAGSVEYRCIYIHNNHGTLTWTSPVIWVNTNTPSADSVIAIGIGSSAVNGTEQTIANETTAPTSVTFTAPSTKGTGLSLGNLPAGQHRAVWIRRTVSAAAAAFNNDGYTLQVEGDTAA